MSKGVENFQKFKFLHRLFCGNPVIKKFPKTKCSSFYIFTKYWCCNESNWPEMSQKLVDTIPFGPGHTLGTLYHGLGSLFYSFSLSVALAKSPLEPPGAPWCLLGPPGGPTRVQYRVFAFSSIFLLQYFCMLWFNIIVCEPPEHRKHHLNPKCDDRISEPSVFTFRDN